MQCEKEGFLKFMPHYLRPGLRNLMMLNFRLGHFKSVWNRKCTDARGEPLPWYTYPAIEYVKQLELRDCVIFEYGAGFSSLFYAQRCQRIHSVEDNPEWHETVSRLAPANSQVILAKSPDEYVNKIYDFDASFDIVVIDGSHRERCCEPALKKLKPTGMIILDNSDWQNTCSTQLTAGNLIQVDMVGFGPLNGYLWATSFFFSRQFSLKSRMAHQPTMTVGP